jgi:3-deoxy-7-phosphoheptulonate synthase
MLIVMKNTATKKQIDDVVKAIEKSSLRAEKLPGKQRTAIGVMGNKEFVDQDRIMNYPGVKEIIHVTKKYKLVSREYRQENTLVKVGNVCFGGKKPVIIAGPCAIESEKQLLAIAKKVKELGADMLRGGAYKPRTSPYSFQGIGMDGLKIMRAVADKVGIPCVSEMTSIADIDLFKKYVDMVQIGSRNMHNFDLIQRVADIGKPILLKRGMSATMEEFLLAAEYILKRGNPNVVLCERGIRTYEPSSRNILDLNTLALIQIESHLPIIADPSHAAGRYDLVEPLAKASLAAGAQGLIVEVHNNPKEALSDGEQSLNFASFKSLMQQI